MEEVPSLPDVDQGSHPSGILPQIVNIVSSVNVGCTLDLRDIASKARNVDYNPKRFNAAVMRIKDPKTTALIFSSGKLVVTGAKSEASSGLANRRFARILQKLGYPAKLLDLKVTNMVGLVDLPFSINLIMLELRVMKTGGKWEPEIFPAIVYRIADPKVGLLIFPSGKVVIAGAKERKDICRAFEQIYPVLLECKRSNLCTGLPLPPDL